jgi:hypothetical protein
MDYQALPDKRYAKIQSSCASYTRELYLYQKYFKIRHMNWYGLKHKHVMLKVKSITNSQPTDKIQELFMKVSS